MAARGDDIAVGPADGNDAYRLIVSDLVSLIEHVQTSLRQIESVIDRESSTVGDDMSADVIVLDDVTPCYVKAGAALKACDVDLDIALFADRFRGSPARFALASRGSAPVVTPAQAITAGSMLLAPCLTAMHSNRRVRR
jgi:hypothetical protein